MCPLWGLRCWRRLLWRVWLGPLCGVLPSPLPLRARSVARAGRIYSSSPRLCRGDRGSGIDRTLHTERRSCNARLLLRLTCSFFFLLLLPGASAVAGRRLPSHYCVETLHSSRAVCVRLGGCTKSNGCKQQPGAARAGWQHAKNTTQCNLSRA